MTPTSDAIEAMYAVAKWLVDPANPLTARVIANRIWQHHFGTGLVATPSDFGAMGRPPTHPELLDWLASELVEGGELRVESQKDASQTQRLSDSQHSTLNSQPHQAWSLKALHRLILLSNAYQQSSAPRPEALAIDAAATFLWRYPPWRLEMEPIRDSILVVSGQLDRTMSGPNWKPNTTSEYGYQFDDARRSVYTPVFRNRLLELFEAFDFADPNLVLGRRNVSTVATQALYLMNSPFAMEQSKVAAERTLAGESSDDAGRLDRAYRTALGRLPTGRERELALEYLREAGGDAIARQEAWERLYQVLFACVDFRYVN